MNAIEQLETVYPPCYTCGTPWTAEAESEAQALIEQNEWYKTTVPKERRDETKVFVELGWQWRCARCMFLSGEQQRESERRWKHDRLIEDTYGYGRVPRSAILHCFAQSDSEIEQRNPETWKLAREWKNDCSFWIQGVKGTGKSFIGHCLLNWALDHDHSVYEANAVDYCEWVYRGGDKQRQHCRDTAVLLLDDIDKPEWRIDSMVQLWRLIDLRWQDNLRTIITANVSPEVMRSRWRNIEGHDRNVVDPMIDRMQGFKRITLEGKSLR